MPHQLPFHNPNSYQPHFGIDALVRVGWKAGALAASGMVVLSACTPAQMSEYDFINSGAPGYGGGYGSVDLPPSYRPLVNQAAAVAARSGCKPLTRAVLAGQLEVEDGSALGWNPDAVSYAGAVGPAQFMPGTWAEWGQGSPTNPADAIRAQERLDCHNYQSTGDIVEALDAYNPGDPSYATAILSYAYGNLSHSARHHSRAKHRTPVSSAGPGNLKGLIRLVDQAGAHTEFDDPNPNDEWGVDVENNNPSTLQVLGPNDTQSRTIAPGQTFRFDGYSVTVYTTLIQSGANRGEVATASLKLER